MDEISACIALLDLMSRLVQLNEFNDEFMQSLSDSERSAIRSPSLTGQSITETIFAVPNHRGSRSVGYSSTIPVSPSTRWVFGTVRDLQCLGYVLIGASEALLLLKEQGVENSLAKQLLQKYLGLWNELEPLLRSVEPSSGDSVPATPKLGDKRAVLSRGLQSMRLYHLRIFKLHHNQPPRTHDSIGREEEVQRLTELLQNAVWGFCRITHGVLMVKLLHFSCEKLPLEDDANPITSCRRFNASLRWLDNFQEGLDNSCYKTPLSRRIPASTPPMQGAPGSQAQPRPDDNFWNHCSVEAIFDNGVNDNFISSKTIQRARIEHLIEDIQDVEVNTSAGSIMSEKKVVLDFRIQGSVKTDTLTFLVCEGKSFDVLLGLPWMNKCFGSILSQQDLYVIPVFLGSESSAVRRTQAQIAFQHRQEALDAQNQEDRDFGILNYEGKGKEPARPPSVKSSAAKSEKVSWWKRLFKKK